MASFDADNTYLDWEYNTKQLRMKSRKEIFSPLLISTLFCVYDFFFTENEKLYTTDINWKTKKLNENWPACKNAWMIFCWLLIAYINLLHNYFYPQSTKSQSLNDYVALITRIIYAFQI